MEGSDLVKLRILFWHFCGRTEEKKNLPIPWNRVLTGSQLVKKFPAYYETRTFITAFTRPRHLSLLWADQSSPCPSHPTSWRSILILFSHIRLGLPGGLFPSGVPTQTLYAPPIWSTCPAHLIPLDLITRTIFGDEYRSVSSSLCSFLNPPCFLVPLRPKYSPQYPVLRHPQPTFLIGSDQVSHPYKITGKIIVLYIVIFLFLNSRLVGKRFCTER